MKTISVKKVAFCGLLAAAYCVLTVATSAFAFGPVQFRVAEVLCLLPFFLPWTTWGCFVGCLAANLFSTVSPLDIVVGSCATLLACLWTGKLRRLYLAPVPAMVCNTVLVGAMLAWVYTPEAFWSGFLTMGAQVLAGETAVLYLLGIPFLLLLKKSRALGELETL